MRAGKTQTKRRCQNKKQQYRKVRKDRISVQRNRNTENGAGNDRYDTFSIQPAVFFHIENSGSKNQKIAGGKDQRKIVLVSVNNVYKECFDNYIY